MSKRKIARRRRPVDAARAAFDDYPRQRIRWIDRVTQVITETPGPPCYSKVTRTCNQLLSELEVYRDGFVHMLNVSKQRHR